MWACVRLYKCGAVLLQLDAGGLSRQLLLLIDHASGLTVRSPFGGRSRNSVSAVAIMEGRATDLCNCALLCLLQLCLQLLHLYVQDHFGTTWKASTYTTARGPI